MKTRRVVFLVGIVYGIVSSGWQARAGMEEDNPGKDEVVARWEFEEGSAEGWAAAHNLTTLEVTGGVVRTRVTGPDAHMHVGVKGVQAEEATHFVVRMRSTKAGQCQVYFGTEEQPVHLQEEVPEFRCPGDNVFRELSVDLSGVPTWHGPLHYLRLDPMNSAGGVGAEVEIDWIRLVRRRARAAVSRFTARQVWVRPGRAVSVRMELVNVDGGVLPDLTAVLRGRQEGLLGTLGTTDKKRRVFEWHAGVGGDVTERLVADVSTSGKLLAQAETLVLTVAPWRLPTPSGRRNVRRTGGCVVVESPQISVVLLGAGSGIDAAVVRMRAGSVTNWMIAGVCMPLAALNVYDGAVNKVIAPRLHVQEVRDREGVVLSGAAGDLGKIKVTISLGKRDEVLDMRTELEALREVDLLRLSGPVLLAGEGSFGAKKSGGLFPGLEYLEGEQRSSNPEGVGEKFGLRVVPWPCEVSVPVMAVGTPEGGVIGMMWDATQAWDGVNGTLMAEYATPNFVDEQENHLMGCFVPTWPAWVERNARVAQQPYRVRRGQRLKLQCRVFGLRVGGMEDVVPFEYEVQGMPKLLVPARTLESTFDVCMQGWAQTCYDAVKDGFVNHWRFGEHATPMPHIKAGLLAHARMTGEQRWIEMVRVPTNARMVDIVGPLWNGFGARAPHVAEAMASQRADGRWVYHCTPEVQKKTKELTGGKYETLGGEGDSNVGICAVPAWHILQHARMTGDAGALVAGTNALEAMFRFRVPAGAQTWEVHMDAPDIFASALAVDCYRIGYELTGDPRYLDAAVRWARTGLPFLYSYQVPDTGPQAHVMIPDDELTEELEADTGLHGSEVIFQNPNRQITPYASLAVFGSSFYIVSWFAHVVQWCGLCWATAVYDLLPYTNDTLLAHAADGVVLSACQQTFDRGPAVGVLPDSWHLESNTIYPAYISPGRLEEALRRKLDLPHYGMSQTALVRGGGGARWHITTRGGVYEARREGGRLKWRQRFLVGEPCDTVIVGVGEPRGVWVNGKSVARVADAGAVEHGWHYDAARGLVCVRVKHGREYEEVSVGLRRP